MGGVVLREDLGHGGRIELERLGPEAVGFLRVIHRLLMKGLFGQFAGLGVGLRIAFRRVLRSSHHALPWQAVRSTACRSYHTGGPGRRAAMPPAMRLPWRQLRRARLQPPTGAVAMPRAIHVLNGPNLNRLGKREPEVYGHTTLAEIEALCRSAAGDAEVVFRQTNYEGQLVDWIHEATDGGADGIIINPAGLSFQSIPVLDALKMFPRPDPGAAHLQHPSARPDLPPLAGFDRCNGGDRRSRGARLCDRHARDARTSGLIAGEGRALTRRRSPCCSGTCARPAAWRAAA